MRFAYADPPYIGQARRHYRCEEINHVALLHHLATEFPEGWVLSCSSPSIEEIAHICRQELGINKVRWGAWVKPFASFKPGVNPAYAWEPVVWFGGRKRERRELTVRDWVSCNITLKKGLCGAKPVPFVEWVIQLLGARRGEDELVDMFPGTGIVGHVWEQKALLTGILVGEEG